MAATFGAKAREPEWHRIELEGEEFFEVQVRPPTASEYLDWLLIRSDGESMRFLVATLVVAWRGVQDATGKAVPFDVDQLLLWASQNARIILALMRLDRTVWLASEVDPKKFDLPSAAPVSAPVADTPNATTSSIVTGSISESSDSPQTSD